MEQPIQKRFENLSPSLEPTEKQLFQNSIRISIYSMFPDLVEEVAAAVVSDAKGMHLWVCGPSVLPNRVTNITTRLNGGALDLRRDIEMQWYGRAVDVLSSTEVVEQIISYHDALFLKMEFEVVDLIGNQIP